ncbi:nuclear transport factor 2 family protein [Kribbella monticola]|uniref:nuclear transport factor 2 family protein n=1 Tax=Kribbella monticola TaxID=2185285 RepID=UPI000DD46BD2|nr:nuclear transport factor 2 family protein [Kribbella monticola]
MPDLAPYLRPFVLDVEEVAGQRVDRVGELDFYRPASTARTGAILLIHGGPGPTDLTASPRDWPVYQGYATAIAQRGLVAVVVDHSLIRGLDQLSAAADDVEAAVGLLRADPQVDPERVLLWFFSGAGLLAGEWLDSRPDWLRGIALSYPRLATPPGVDELVSAAEVIGKDKNVPVLLTRVGRERDELAGPVAEFVSAGGAALDIIDVPKGQHGFDMLDHTDESRAAVTKALDWAIAHLGEDPTGQLPIPTPTPAVTIPAATPARTAVAATTPRTGRTVASTDSAEPAAGSSAVRATKEPKSSATEELKVSPPQADTPAARVVGREHSAYEAHDLEAFLAMYSPTAQLQTADGSVLRGRRSLREYYRPRFEAGQCKTELVHRMTQGEWVVDQAIVHDPDQGPVPTISFYRVQEGLITEVRILG